MRRQEARPRLNVLYVGDLPPYPSGGAAIVGAYLVAGLAARGHRVRALAAMTPQAFGGRDRFVLRHPRVTVERYPVPYARAMRPPDEAFRRLEGEGIGRTLPRLIECERPQIIIAGQESVAWHVPPLARASAIPCVQLVHGGGSALMSILRGCAGFVERELVQRFRETEMLIAVARHLAESVVLLGLPEVQIIPNPVDLARFRPGRGCPALRRTLDLADEEVVVAHVSSLREVKRPLDVVESAALALRQSPRRLVYVIVGDGPGRAAMERACHQEGIDGRFRFVGWVEHERVAEYLRLASILLMPSAHEGQSLVYLESLACGRPLVASDIPAAREVVVHGETGLLFPVGDVKTLAALTLKLAADPALGSALGERAREAARAYGLKKFLARYEAALLKAAQTGRR